ncbi:MAG: autotransporter-associated beta strand repeat-containing protein [Kiritimatiellae bacterium]|nr:autotransporter-associated beta strand repeat-containing protein [Kiritimatiellia bacterium]
MTTQSSAATWTGTTGSFTNKLNWESATLPKAGDSVVITNGGTAQFDGGTVAGLAVVGIGTGSAEALGTLEMGAGELSMSRLLVGSDGGTGVVTQTGGKISQTGEIIDWRISDTAGSIGNYYLQDGDLDTGGANFQIGAYGAGNLLQTGGTVSCGQWPVVGRYKGGVGHYTLSGGKFNQTTSPRKLIIGEAGTGTLTINGSGVAQLVGGLQLSGGSADTGIGTVNLETGGTMITPTIVRGPGYSGTFNFDGGTLLAPGSGATYPVFMQGLTTANVLAGGAIIDSGNNVITVEQNLKSGAAPDGGLTKLGSGSLILADENSYTGTTKIEAGTVKVKQPELELAHRWSFNNSLEDSVGSSHATAHDSVAAGSNQYTLAGGSSVTSYIALGTNILPKTNAPVTIELWATQHNVQNWSRIFDFGSSTANYIIMSWTQGTDLNKDRVVCLPNGGSADETMQPYTLNQEFHISMVITPGADAGGRTLLQWYKMNDAGVTLRSGSMSVDFTLADLVQNNMWLGHSQWPNDYDANASYNEVRIWNIALTKSQLEANAKLGADFLPKQPQAVLPSSFVTVEAVQDNEVRAPTYADEVQQNGGTAAKHWVRNDYYTNPRRKMYAKFDLSKSQSADLDAPATLTLCYTGYYSYNGGTGCWIMPYALKSGFVPAGSVLGIDWQESDITWNNAPANQTEGLRFTSDAENLLVGEETHWWILYSTKSGTRFKVDLPRLGDYVQSDNTVTVMFTAGFNTLSGKQARSIYFAAKEHPDLPGPQLTYKIKYRGTVIMIK